MNIDKQLVERRFSKRFATYHRLAVVQKEMALRLSTAIAHRRADADILRGLEIGIGTGFLSTRLLEQYPTATWYFNDLVAQAFDWVSRQADQKHVAFLPGDAERIAFPEKLDLLASASAMQWFEDIPAFLSKASTALNPGGLLALGTFAPGNLDEVNRAAGSGLEYPSVDCLKQWLLATGFRGIHIECWEHALLFPNAAGVLRHLRDTGVNAVTSSIWTPRRLRCFCDNYERQFRRPNGNVTLTYKPLLLTAVR